MTGPQGEGEARGLGGEERASVHVKMPKRSDSRANPATPTNASRDAVWGMAPGLEGLNPKTNLKKGLQPS
jgi:hypothetical protein